MKSKLCPYKRHCHSSGDCENCDFGKAFDGLQGKIDRLKKENMRLEAENQELRDRIDIITNPNF